MSLPPLNPETPKLGSLAQSARGKKLREARNILLAVGILTLIGNGILLAVNRTMVEAEVKRLEAQGNLVDPQDKERAVRIGYIAHGIGLALGLVFITLAIMIRSFPVPATVISLVLYTGAVASYAALSKGESIKNFAFIIQIAIIVALIHAVRTAVAYRKEEIAAASAEPEYER
jgi:hypothetical protein